MNINFQKEISRYLNSSISQPFFIAVDDVDNYQILLDYILNYTNNVMRVSNYCNKDSLPNYDLLLEDISLIEDRRLLIGLGECLYLSDDSSTLSKIKESRFKGKLIVLCRCISNQLQRLNSIDRKFNSRFWLDIPSSLDFQVIRVASDVEFNAIENFKNFLSIIEYNNFDNSYIKNINNVRRVYVKTLVPIKYDSYIKNNYEALKEEQPSLDIPQSFLSNEQWKEYRENPKDDNDLLSMQTFINLKIHRPSKAYLANVIDSAKNYNEYIDLIYEKLFDFDIKHPIFWDLYNERKSILKKYSDRYEFAKHIKESFRFKENSIYYLTDISNDEKQAIVENIAKHKFLPNDLEKIYPDLASYLKVYHFNCQNNQNNQNNDSFAEYNKFFTEYFSEYKNQKILNQINPNFLNKIEEISKNGNRKFIVLRNREYILDNIKNKSKNQKQKLYWVDALGVEFLSIIASLANEIKLRFNINIGKAKLPTLTYFNKDFFDQWSGDKAPKYDQIDNIKHGNVISSSDGTYPLHLVEELNFLRELIKNIKSDLETHDLEKIILTSDHGTSRLAVINNNEKIIAMTSKGEHGGRCCPFVENDTQSDSMLVENNYFVLANYDRFKGSRKPSVEVHGGASLEEVLVPIIEFSLPKKGIKISLYSNQLFFNSLTGEYPVLEIFCKDYIENLNIIFKGRKYYARRDEKNYTYIIELKDVRKADNKCNAEVYAGDTFISTVSFSINSKSASTNSSDDDFFI